MSFCRGIEIIGCTKPQRRILTHVDLREPNMIGLDINGYHPSCAESPISLPLVNLIVTNRNGIIIIDGDKVADVHLECPEKRCPFHWTNKRIVNCFATFPTPPRSDGHSICFARTFVDRNLPTEVDLAPVDGGFSCGQKNCPLHRQFLETINLHS